MRQTTTARIEYLLFCELKGNTTANLMPIYSELKDKIESTISVDVRRKFYHDEIEIYRKEINSNSRLTNETKDSLLNFSKEFPNYTIVHRTQHKLVYEYFKQIYLTHKPTEKE